VGDQLGGEGALARALGITGAAVSVLGFAGFFLAQRRANALH
jgi:hypothetical protein